jgi:hypothetical protein
VEKIPEPMSEIVDWLGDKISGAWEWTKEKAAAFWECFTEFCSQIALKNLLLNHTRGTMPIMSPARRITWDDIR